jgi:hypothetical protein
MPAMPTFARENLRELLQVIENEQTQNAAGV